MEFLATKDRAFEDVKSPALKTTFTGVHQIYDMLDKRLKRKGDGTPGSVVKTKPKVTPDKVTTRATKELAQIQDKPPIVQVTGDYLGGGTDEKEMAYRKEIISDDSPLNIEPSNRQDSSEMDEAAPVTMDPVERNVPFQLVEAGEMLINLTRAY